MSSVGESEIGKKRRLPLWMSSAKVVVDKNESSSSSSSIIHDEEKKTSPPPKPGGIRGKRRIEKKKTTCQEEEEEEDDFSICIQEDDDLSLPGNKRIKKHVVNSKPKPKPKPKPPIRSHKNNPKRPSQLNMVVNDDEEDVDLTVDDLITIAQEYVRADDGKDCDEGVTTEPEPRKQSLATSLTSRDDSGRSVIGNDLLPSHTSLDLFLKSDQTKSRDQKHSESEEIIHNATRTGDPAQDMLDLFLGPLLQKPQTTKEIRCEAVREEIELDIDSQIQSQREGLGKWVPTVGKKKTSLKDKVAMLLD